MPAALSNGYFIAETLSISTPRDPRSKMENMGCDDKNRKPRDLLVRRALRFIREQPEKRWTVESLAAAVGTSRPVLCRRFKEELGVPPLRALREVRMRRAAALLLTTEEKLAAIADQVGYDSEFAFSRAFFRHHGVRPGVYRRTALSSGPILMAA